MAAQKGAGGAVDKERLKNLNRDLVTAQEEVIHIKKQAKET